MTFAPGPYTTVEIGCGAGFHAYIVDRNGRKIGVAWGPITEKVWTAALFAGAPDLLAALKRLTAGMNDSFDSNPAVLADEVRQARAAIAKVEGTTLSATERDASR